MPSKNIIKQYIEDGYYHVYNRGVEKRSIFQDDQDRSVFIDRLRKYLDPDYQPPPGELMRSLSLAGQVEVAAYCLMPNHFHLLIHQISSSGMEELMRRVMTSYSMYFNSKYKRVGSLFQGRYKAVLITTDEQLIHLSKYIHLNPRQPQLRLESNYSSLPYFTQTRAPVWLNNQPILRHFKNQLAYAHFVNDYDNDSTPALEGLTLE